MKRNIIVAKNALSSDLCNKIIEIAKPGFASALVSGGLNQPTIRKSETSFLVGSIKYLDIYIPILQLIKKVNDDFYNFDLLEPEHFQITKYDEKNQGFYKPHEDGLYDNVSSDQLVRKLSVSIQLTSPEYYEGGTFDFPDDKEKFVVEDSLGQGTAIFFPSYMKHGVVPVTKGTRYSLVCWVNGYAFR
jgi:PKHD-type hydroxylase